MTPPLYSILLSVSSLLSDAQTLSIPARMHDLNFLTPTSPRWLDNVSELFRSVVSRDKPSTAREALLTVEAIHTSLRGVPAYRKHLGRCVCELAEEALDKEGADTSGAGVDGDEFLFKVCTNEFVWRTIESVSVHPGMNESEAAEEPLDELSERIIALYMRYVTGPCPCLAAAAAAESTAATGQQTPQPQDLRKSTNTRTSMSHSHSYESIPSQPATPTLSRVSSDLFSHSHSQPQDNPPPVSSGGGGGVLPPLMAMLPSSWTLSRPREREPSTEQPSPLAVVAETPTSTNANTSQEQCRPFSAAIALVEAFQALAFSAPLHLAYAIRVFRCLLSVLDGDGKGAAPKVCQKARMTVLQLLMRLRADRDHKVFVLSAHALDEDGDVRKLAGLVDRVRGPDGKSVHGWLEDGSNAAEVRRTRSTTRSIRGSAKRGSEGVAKGSRSRSRLATIVGVVPPPVPTAPKVLQPPLWVIPDTLPFTTPICRPSSAGIKTFEPNAPPEWEELKHWLPVSEYMSSLLDVLTSTTPDWEILSYVLCHLPAQLTNKHFFCGPKTRDGIVKMLTTLCSVTLRGEAGQFVAELLPEPLRLRDAHGLVYHTLAVLISYRRIFDERKHQTLLVESFLLGLSSTPETVKVCLNALSICAVELPVVMTKNLAFILEKLTRLMTNADMAVHILDFVCIVGSLPKLYANFREEEFKTVFAVAVSYIHHHNSPDMNDLSGRESFALSQHVLVVAYFIIYVWFLALDLEDRPKHVEFIARRLLLANEAKGYIDEPTEVCFDWLARYTYATADPRPTSSLLGDIVMNPASQYRANDDQGGSGSGFGYGYGHGRQPEQPSPTKTWLWGNSLVSIRTLPKRGWIEVQSVRPSGETRFLCKLENFPQVGPGDVDPDWLTDAAVLMMDRDPEEIARDVPDPEADQSRSSVVRSILVYDFLMQRIDYSLSFFFFFTL
jgi:hypothetical protein